MACMQMVLLWLLLLVVCPLLLMRLLRAPLTAQELHQCRGVRLPL
jgi:hypothetical protein